MCSCGGKKNQTWTVTYPPEADRAPEIKRTASEARKAASLVPGATYAETPK